MPEPHIVPLSRQAIAILRGLPPLMGSGQYVFPFIRSGSRQMSENTINGALQRLSHTNAEMTAHGFRAMACLNEQGCIRT